MTVRWRRPAVDAWEARACGLVLFVYVDPDVDAWTWQVCTGTWTDRTVWWDRSRPPPQRWADEAASEEAAIRDGMRALARATSAAPTPP